MQAVSYGFTTEDELTDDQQELIRADWAGEDWEPDTDYNHFVGHLFRYVDGEPVEYITDDDYRDCPEDANFTRGFGVFVDELNRAVEYGRL